MLTKMQASADSTPKLLSNLEVLPRLCVAKPGFLAELAKASPAGPGEVAWES